MNQNSAQCRTTEDDGHVHLWTSIGRSKTFLRCDQRRELRRRSVRTVRKN